MLLDVDSMSYRPAIERALMNQDYTSCSPELLAMPDSPYASALDCHDAIRIYEREKGYLYRACAPEGRLVYVLSRVPVAPGRFPLPDTARAQPPPPGFELVRLGRAYQLDLTPLPLIRGEPVGYDSTFRGPQGPLPIFLHDSSAVSDDMYDRYHPLGSDALHGRYIRNGLRIDTVASEPNR